MRWALSVSALLILTGCAAKPTSEKPETATTTGYAAGRPAVTIQFWYEPYGGPVQDQSVLKEVAAFHQEHPNITVVPTRVPWNDALTRLSTASTSGQGPDVAQLGTTWVGGFSALNALRPYTSAEIAAVGGEPAFTPASWTSSHRLGTDRITALPWLTDIRTILYRTDVLRRAGLKPETAFATWASFEHALGQIKKRVPGISPLAIGNQNNFGIIHNVAPFIWGAGGDLLAADGKHSLLAEAPAVDAVTYYQRLIALYDDPKANAMDSSQVPDAFADGVGAVTTDNSQSIGDYLANPNRAGLKAGWATAPLPAGPAGRFAFLGGSNLSILSNAKTPDAAFEWVRFLVGHESQQRYAVNSGLWPARADAVAGTRLATDPHYAAYRTMLKYARAYPAVPAWTNIETVIAKDFATLWHASTPMPRDAVAVLLRKTSSDIDDVLAQGN